VKRKKKRTKSKSKRKPVVERRPRGLKLFLEIEIFPFRGENSKYSGLYTPKGRKNQRGKIEIDANKSLLEQVWAFCHEIGHFICDVWLGDAHKNTPREEAREHLFCNPLGDLGERLFKKFLKSDLASTNIPKN
jgi:Zn-dependent peptidase ImmA (M78 family)